MKRAYKILMMSLVASLATVTLHAQNFNDSPAQMQDGDDEYSYDDVNARQRPEAKPHWVEIEYPGGDSYKGDQVAGQNHGLGAYYWSDGSRYEGEFKNGNYHGRGVLYFASGATRKGIWENDVYIGTGEDSDS